MVNQHLDWQAAIMEASKRLELFYDALKEEYKSYVEDVVKSFGFAILAVGWVITSEPARAYLAERTVNTGAPACTAVLAAFNLALYIGHYFRSARLAKQILLLDAEATELVANYILRPAHIVLNFATISGLFLLLTLLIYTLRK